MKSMTCATAFLKHLSCGVLSLLVFSNVASAQLNPIWQRDGKILGTGGVSSISGAAGGGLIPWATLGTYADSGQVGGSAFYTQLAVDDYELKVRGGAMTVGNRIELSHARQTFTVKSANSSVTQDKSNIKIRLFGDIIFDEMPQISLGIEHGRLYDKNLALSVGAPRTEGTDYIMSMAKAWLDGIGSRTTLLNVNIRHSQSNQFGILGYGGDDMSGKWTGEISAAVFVTRHLVAGWEYRQKSDNLSVLKEENAKDLFLAWLPNKRFSVTAAWVNLGEIAGAPNQNGAYISAQLNF